ncbi:hypothetical protein [Streptomyces sp. NPDC059262]
MATWPASARPSAVPLAVLRDAAEEAGVTMGVIVNEPPVRP